MPSRQHTTHLVNRLSMPAHIYIHFPFCVSKCGYCDFFSQPMSSTAVPRTAYTRAVINEMRACETLWPRQGDGHGESVRTVSFGGGTPSLFDPANVCAILSALREQWGFAPRPEVTLECNPGTMTHEKMLGYSDAGVNRFSVGVQSFQDSLLQRMGRIHSAREARETLSWLVRMGDVRVSLDLIYGYPGQTLAEWEADLNVAIDSGAGHLSCYALTIETQTPLAAQIKEQQTLATETDLLADMQELTYAKVRRAGFGVYEISNFSREGFECRHNIDAYWKYGSYLGLGAGAVSQWQGVKCDAPYGDDHVLKSGPAVCRWMNQCHIKNYLQGDSVRDVESIDVATAMKEFIMMGLRTRWGINETVFEERFGQPFLALFGPGVEQAVGLQWACFKDHTLIPTEKGMLMNNALTRLFF